MKIVVLGCAGMLGHVAGLFFKEKYGTDVILSARRKTGISSLDEDLKEISLTDFGALKSLLQQNRPCVVVNCAAVNDAARNGVELEQINSLLPQKIADLLDGFKDGSRLIHISTDGVFRGDRGQYGEDDTPDAQDAYGISKRLGEVSRSPHLTIRTSLIGPDPISTRGLLNWMLCQSGEVRGFRKVFWNGVTTLELAHFVDYAVDRNITGLYHLCGEILSKYDVLVYLRKLCRSGIVIVPDDAKVLNRSLISHRTDIPYVVSPFSILLQQLKLWILQHPRVYCSMSDLDAGNLNQNC